MRAAACLLALALSGCLRAQLNDAALSPRERYEVFPERFGLSAEDVFAVTEDGVALHGWLFHAAAPRGVVVILHGNMPNISPYACWAPSLVSAGYHVLLVNYRGFGPSQGEADLWSLGVDGEAMLALVRARPELRGLPVGLLGISLGTLVALALADEPEVRAVVLDSAFEPRHKLRQYTESDVLTALGALVLIPGALDSLGLAGSIDVPLLMVHGEHDRVALVDEGLAVFAEAPEEQRWLWVAQGAGHSPGPAGWFGETYSRAVVAFFDRWLAGAEERPWLQVQAEHVGSTVTIKLSAPDGPPPGPVPVEVVVATRDDDEDTRLTWLRRTWTPGDRPWQVSAPGELLAVSALAFGPEEVEALPDGTWTHRLDAFARTTRALHELDVPDPGDPVEEVEACQVALDRVAAEADPRLRLRVASKLSALSYAWHQDPARALACMRAARALVPEDPQALMFLGDARWDFADDRGERSAVVTRLGLMVEDPAERVALLAEAERLDVLSYELLGQVEERTKALRARVDAANPR